MTYAERVYFGEAQRDIRPVGRYETDIFEAARLARKGNLPAARTILRELIEHHYSEEPATLEEYAQTRARVAPAPAEYVAAMTARVTVARRAWERFRDELYALYVDPAQRPSHEICAYGGDQ